MDQSGCDEAQRAIAIGAIPSSRGSGESLSVTRQNGDLSLPTVATASIPTDNRI